MYTIVVKIGVKGEIVLMIADDLWIPFSDNVWASHLTHEEAGQILGGN